VQPTVGVGDMKLPLPYQLAVERLVANLPVDEVNWALTGSVAHRLQGADIECHDVDVQTDAPGAYDVATRLHHGSSSLSNFGPRRRCALTSAGSDSTTYRSTSR
jgi:hypothetical protein